MGKGGARLVTTRRRAFSDLMGTDAGGAMADGQQPLNTGSPGPSDEGHNPLGQDTPRSSVGSAIGTAKTICIERANAIIYLICAFSFAPASICFTPIWEEYEVPGVWVFLFGSIGFMWVALCDARETWQLHQQNGDEMAQFINCLMYAFGSFTFIVGSVLFLPIFPHSWTFGALRCGAILFTVGSVVFTFAAFLNVTEVRRNTEVDAEQMKLVITVLYGFGGVIFVIGSIFFLPSLESYLHCECLLPAGGWLFFAGSLFYFFGAILNFYKIDLEEKRHKAELLDGHSGAGGADGVQQDLSAELSRARSAPASRSQGEDGNILADLLRRSFASGVAADDARVVM